MRSHHLNRTLAVAGAVALPAVLIATAALAASADRAANVKATFAAATLYKTHAAVTYDRSSVPAGSLVQIVERPQKKGGDAGNVTIETLAVAGLRANRKYDAYVYSDPCGATPGAAGRRTQDGTNSQHYPQNEVWLGFTTDRRGNAVSRAGQYWRFNVGRASRANSVAIYSHPSEKPLACVTVPFS